MAKAHWGIKRVCNNGICGAKFYDFNEKAIACPKCGAAYSQKLMSRSFLEERSTSEEDVAEGAVGSESESESESGSSESEETAVDAGDATAEGNAVALEEAESFS